MITEHTVFIVLCFCFCAVSLVGTFLVRECIRLRVRNAELMDRDIEKIMEQITVEEFDVKMGLISVRPGMGMAAVFANSFYELLGDAENYVEGKFVHRKSGDIITVTVRRHEGMTPGEKATQLQKELDFMKENAILSGVMAVTSSIIKKG